MAISKIILNGEVQMDVTSDTAAASNMLNGTTATKNDGTKVTGTIASKSSSDLTASGATVTAPAGYYSANASKSVTTMTLPTTTSTSATSGYTLKATLDRSTSDRYLNIAPGYNSAGGYYKINKVANGSVTAPSSISGTSATVSTGTNTLTLTKSVSVTPNVTTAGYISSGTAGNSSVSLTASVTTKGAATITPSTSEQSIAAGTYLTGKQTISAMPSGTAGTPTASKGSVSNNSISVTPSVTNTTGYITGGTKTGTAVTVSASELVSGTKSITENGTGVDVTNYASVDVEVTPNLVDLEIEPSRSNQIFDGSYYVLKQISVLQGSTPSSSTTERTVTIPIDLSELEYGQTYHLQCNYIYVYQGGQRANIISIDTDWTASENGSVDFVYNEHLGSWNITSVTLSKTAINFTFDSNMGGLTVHTINDGFAEPFIVYGICDGYKHIYAWGAKLQTKTVTPSSEYQTIIPDDSYYGLDTVIVEPAVSQLTYGTFTITANNTTTEANIGYLSMCSFAGSTTTYHPAYVATKVSGGTNIAYLGRWIINPSDGYMYVTFVGTNDTYTPNITATSGTATLVTSKLSGGTIEDKGHFYKSMRVYKISNGAVLTASYVNNN